MAAPSSYSWDAIWSGKLTPVRGMPVDDGSLGFSAQPDASPGALFYDANGNFYKAGGTGKPFTLLSGAGGSTTQPKTSTTTTKKSTSSSGSTYNYAEQMGVPGMGALGGSLYTAGALPKGMNASIATVYRNLFGRLPNRSQHDVWLERLQGGMSIQEIERRLRNSTEFKAQGGEPIGTYLQNMTQNPELPEGTAFKPVDQKVQYDWVNYYRSNRDAQRYWNNNVTSLKKAGIDNIKEFGEWYYNRFGKNAGDRPPTQELLWADDYALDPDGLKQSITTGKTSTAAMPTRQGTRTMQAYTIGPDGTPQAQFIEGEMDPRSLVEAQYGTLSQAALNALTPPEGVVDPRATVQWQYQQLTSGDMNWARGAMREAQAMMASRGVGNSTMAGEAVTSAILQAALPIAQQDAKVFETMTLKNLDLKAQATFLKAGYLAEMDMKNLDNRQQAAVLNAQAFMALDMKNLENAQQVELINTQNRMQTMLSDQAAENAARQFNAESVNQMNQFWATTTATMNQFNAAQKNEMSRFNTDQVNSMRRFNAEMQNQREQFNSTMAMQIDQSNAQYLRSINTLNTAMKNQAAYVNAQNLLGLHNAAMANQIQVMRDQMAYLWTTGENQANRLENQALMKLNAAIVQGLYKQQSKDQQDATFGGLLGSVLGGVAKGIFGNLF